MSKCDQCHFGSGFHRPGCTATDHPALAGTGREITDVLYAYECLQPGKQGIWCEFFDRDKPKAGKHVRNVRRYLPANAATVAAQPAPATGGEPTVTDYGTPVDKSAGGELDVEAERREFAATVDPQEVVRDFLTIGPIEAAFHIWLAARVGSFLRAPSNNSPVGAKEQE
jgi:hypothetical protein